MKYRIINQENNRHIVRIEDKSIIISDEQSALDIFMSLLYETEANRFILDKENFTEEFFDLSSKIAGGILQKIVNYKIKLVIVGDFSLYKSKALRDFIYECNKGKDIFFVRDEQDACQMLLDAKM